MIDKLVITVQTENIIIRREDFLNERNNNNFINFLTFLLVLFNFPRVSHFLQLKIIKVKILNYSQTKIFLAHDHILISPYSSYRIICI